MECKYKKPDGSCEIYSMVSMNGYNKVEISNNEFKIDGVPVNNINEINIKATADNITAVTLKFDADINLNLTNECVSSCNGKVEDVG